MALGIVATSHSAASLSFLRAFPPFFDGRELFECEALQHVLREIELLTHEFSAGAFLNGLGGPVAVHAQNEAGQANDNQAQRLRNGAFHDVLRLR